MTQAFFHGFRARFAASPLGNAFAPRKPRNPLLRVAFGLLGVALLLVLLVVGLVVGTLMIGFALLRRLLGRSARPGAIKRDDAFDAEYRVVRKGDQPLLR
ncbi:hypothetical protein E2F46_03315 [Luteimonas aestuarii]|uniref:Uncharacterized protein n=1 Tax=Luteimonas aestuarii TaxID=453837 RepID=A0A4R5U0Y8_9GAMM|nr:hypothetical protein [Luteimonas aestuarii]TDK27246.1 hypothetical protein E2F46_03315 [Luteimonas aestuarii]